MGTPPASAVYFPRFVGVPAAAARSGKRPPPPAAYKPLPPAAAGLNGLRGVRVGTSES